jgi:hypothetical protein
MSKYVASILAVLLLAAPVSASETVGQRLVETFANACILRTLARGV